MKVLSIINLKGGVAKTISSVNMAHILAAVKGFKVLLIDNDKQGNASKIMNRHSYDHKGTAEVMTQRGIDPAEVIQHTDFEGLDIITANMNLLTANLEVMLDQSRPQQTRFKKFLDGLQNEYDYCIIDNAPDINISTINALVASDDVMVPITIDDFAKVSLRVAKIKACEKVPKSDKLYKLLLDDGEGERQIVSGIAKWYAEEELVGKKVIVVANLKPAKLRGVESNGMLLAADAADGSAKVLFVDDSVECGAAIH